MNEAFRDQGGVASSDPSWLRRRLTSMLMKRLADPRRLERARRKAETARIRAGEPHRVEYFHQPDDPYSQLAAQMLEPLARRYDIVLVPHLVHGARGANTPEPQLLAAYARRDAAAIAPHYGLEFPRDAAAPASDALERGQRLLAGATGEEFAALACAVGSALWNSAPAALAALETRARVASPAETASRLAAGDARREALGHYSGAMFHYGGEWYWGVDRLYHLEQRLRALGAVSETASALIAPRPAIEAPAGSARGLVLEFFASLRSPYTSIIYDRTRALARESGIELRLRPVLPMVMRGVPVTMAKGRYIFFDTAREAATLGLAWGNAHDPIGEPVRRVYSLLPWARTQGRAQELLGCAAHAAFFEAVNLGSDAGLRTVVERAGLAWNEARVHLGATEWQAEFEQNRQAMYAAGLWGVPSFRLLDADGTERLAAWGQDRLWLVAREIARLAAR